MKRLLIALFVVAMLGLVANTASADHGRYRGYGGSYQCSPYRSSYGYRGYGPSYYGRSYAPSRYYGSRYGYGYRSGYYPSSGIGVYGNRFSLRIGF